MHFKRLILSIAITLSTFSSFNAFSAVCGQPGEDCFHIYFPNNSQQKVSIVPKQNWKIAFDGYNHRCTGTDNCFFDLVLKRSSTLSGWDLIELKDNENYCVFRIGIQINGDDVIPTASYIYKPECTSSITIDGKLVYEQAGVYGIHLQEKSLA